MYDTYEMYKETKAVRFEIDNFIRENNFQWFSREVEEVLGNHEKEIVYRFTMYALAAPFQDRTADARWYNLERMPTSSCASFESAISKASNKIEKEALALLIHLVEQIQKINILD